MSQISVFSCFSLGEKLVFGSGVLVGANMQQLAGAFVVLAPKNEEEIG